MILYNVTVNIAKEVHTEWLEWMKTKHIPDVFATGLFVEHKVLRMLTDDANSDFTYAFQYFLNSMEDLETYQKEHAQRLQAEHTERYKDKFVAFRSLLEVVD